MAISLKTDWSKIRYVMFVIFFVSALSASIVATGLPTSGKQKRQLFREHLLPQQGGKIPSSALTPARLILNKFSQNGLYTSDGYHLQQRPERHHHPKQFSPNTLKVRPYPDNRYVAPPGRQISEHTVDTTYLIPEPVNFILYPPIRHYSPSPFLPQASLKILRQFKYEKFNKNHIEIFSSNELPEKILMELAPYLRKLHETD